MYSVYDFPEVYDAVMQHSPEVIAAEVASIERLLAERGVTHGTPWSWPAEPFPAWMVLEAS